jgi:hypothetical protein
MRLAELQGVFQRYLLEGDAAPIAAEVTGTESVPVHTRLAIYGDGYELRLIEALQHSWPALAHLAGDEDFEALARDYIRTHPSVFRSVRYYGDQLPGFLASQRPYADNPLLSEMARWEWALAAVFDARDAVPISVDALTQIEPEDWAELRFGWNPAIEVVALQWNTARIWKAVTEDTPVPEPQPLARAGGWLLWRSELQIYFRQLGADEEVALAAARAGQSFGELCEALCLQLGDESAAPAQAAGFLRGWIESGLIVAVQPPSRGV